MLAMILLLAGSDKQFIDFVLCITLIPLILDYKPAISKV